MWHDLKEFFSIQRPERRGIIVLIFIFLFFLLIIRLSHIYIKPIQYEEGYLLSIADSLEMLTLASQASSSGAIKNTSDFHVEENRELSLFYFDPNTISEDELQKMGLQEYQIKNLINYREKGGKFYQPTDILKLYAIPDSIKQAMVPFVRIKKAEAVEQRDKEERNNFNKEFSYEEWYRNYRVELNRADTSALKKLRGIGDYYARKIIEHREKLGGYFSIDQLAEIYLFRKGMVDTLSANLEVDTTLIRKIDINRCTAGELSYHPYINFKAANKIVSFRERGNKYKKVEDLRKNDLLPDSLFFKIRPYLTATK